MIREGGSSANLRGPLDDVYVFQLGLFPERKPDVGIRKILNGSIKLPLPRPSACHLASWLNFGRRVGRDRRIV
jgi:hypothetical protein